ncbi:hypothetical protein H0W26_05650, partial [Candidatus Dependentiae bacterium]|nr:hypothetical protein [Candidatus Dependentiae bacterium]
VAIDSQNRIVVAGTTNDGTVTRAAVARFTESGTLDTSFALGSSIPGVFVLMLGNDTTTAGALTLTQDDEIYVAGSDKNSLITQFLLFKLTPDGFVDQTFTGVNSPEGIALLSIQGTDDSASAIGIDSEGRIVAGGFSSESSGVTDFALVRYLPSGVLDLSFDDGAVAPGIVLTTFGGNSGAIDSLAFDSLENIVVTGVSNTGTNDAFTTARYTSSGFLDGTFGSNGVVITDIPLIIPSFSNPGSAGTGVVVGANDILYISGFSFDGIQDNFTTLSYLPSGVLNPAFNILNPGVVITVLGTRVPLGNGIPYAIPLDISAVSPDILENVLYPVEPVEPVIDAQGPLLTNDFQPYLRGSATPNSVITVYLNEIPVIMTLADFTGNWEVILPPLLDGVYSVTVSAANSMTGLSLSSLAVSLTIATQPPAPPVVQTPLVGQKFSTAIIVVSGKAEASQEVTIFIDRVNRGTVRATNGGVWSLPVGPLATGAHVVAAGATDKAGNSSSLSQEVGFVVDTRALSAPRIITPQNGTINTTSTVKVTGEAPPNSSVRVYVNDREQKVVKATAQGAWSLSIPSLTNGQYRIRAYSLDKRVSSEIISFTVNNRPSPKAQQPMTLKQGYIQGRADPGSVITLFLGDQNLGQVVANAQGAWSYGPLQKKDRKPGPYSLSLTIADKKGAISSVVKQEVLL